MTQPSSPSQEPAAKPAVKGFKVTLLQGIIGAVTLAGTTAIPIVVKQALETRPVVSPATVAPAQVTPSSAAPAAEPAQVTPSSAPVVETIIIQPEANAPVKRSEPEDNGKGRKVKD